MSKKSDVKACPCCGAKAEPNYGRSWNECWCYIVCTNCGLKTRNHHGKTDKETFGKALSNWNQRTESQ